MAKDEKNGGFFSRFKKSEAASEATPPKAQSRGVVSTPESRNTLVSGALSKTAAVAPEPVEDPALSEPLIDTFEAINVYCRSLVEIGTSQLMVVDRVLGMLSNSLNKIVEGSGTKE